MIPERFEFSAGKCLHQRAAKTIVLQGCDVENTLEHTSDMAAKGVFSISATYYAADNSNMTNCAKKNWHAENMHTLLPERRNFTAEVNSVCPNSQERFKP